MNWLTRVLSTGAGKALEPGLADRLRRWSEQADADLARSHFEARYVVVNTEASGLDPAHDRLLAVASIEICDGVIQPGQAIYAALEPDPAVAMVTLLEACGRAPLVVFNAGLNRSQLERAFETHLGLKPELHWLDLYWLLPALFPELHRQPVRLQEWMQSFGIETFQRHHALGDAYAIAQLAIAMLPRALAHGEPNARALAEAERALRWMRQSG
jgi:DNA polymerase-3 subunit epsilon